MYSIIRNTCIGKATQLEAAVISLSRTFRCEFHVSVALNKQIKRSPENKHRLQHPIRTSWGKMVSRGMRVKEPVTKYTVKPQPVQKTGGRGVTGRREIGYIGGGLPVVWHMTDCVRITKNEQDPKVEVVKEIIPEQTRSSHIALVIGGEKKRWIMATESMKVGDMIKSTRDIPHIPVMPQAGDCHPVGALPIGTQVCQVERYPFDGSKVGNAAGVSMTLLRKSGDKVTLRMPSKREMTVSEQCLCVVGRNSDVERNKRQLGKAGAKRQLGYRPSSGLRMKKTGLHGRKIKSIKKSREYTEPETQETEVLKFTLPLHFTQGRHRGVTLWY